jgi:hypothetical protein
MIDSFHLSLQMVDPTRQIVIDWRAYEPLRWMELI